MQQKEQCMYFEALSDDYEHKYDENINLPDALTRTIQSRSSEKRSIKGLAALETNSDQLKRSIARQIVRDMNQRDQKRRPDLKFRSFTEESKEYEFAEPKTVTFLTRGREKANQHQIARENMQAGRSILTLFNTQRATKTAHGYTHYKSYTQSNKFMSNSSERKLLENVDFLNSGKLYETELVANCGTQVRLVRRVKL
jgi:hypothetical protein